jgi:hypothetical protein
MQSLDVEAVVIFLDRGTGACTYGGTVKATEYVKLNTDVLNKLSLHALGQQGNYLLNYPNNSLIKLNRT